MGLAPVFWWLRLDLVFLVGRTASSGVFWDVCELSMILGSLFANGWCCVPVLLVVWHGVCSTGACWSLSGAGSYHWGRDLWESCCQLILCGARRSLVVQCPELGFPTSEAQAWHQAGAPRPFQPHGWSHICQQKPSFCSPIKDASHSQIRKKVFTPVAQMNIFF